MSPQRFATLGAVCGTVVLASWIVAGFTGFGFRGVEHTDAMPIKDSGATVLAVAAEPVKASQTTIVGKTRVASANVVTADPESSVPAVVPAAAPVAEAAADEPAPSDTMPTLPSETSTEPVAMASTADPEVNAAQEATPSTTPDECPASQACIDEYLWSLYQRTPKFDTIKVTEKKKMSVKKKGKTRTVVKNVTKLVDEDFTWKDPKAAEKAGMSMQEYVIGGMDPGFKLKLYHVLRALDDAGLMPGITSAFRDDYRQSLAAGLKAASDRSYHGGSSHGGYGHGLAVDLVSVRGETRTERCASSDILWKWIDAHGAEFGVGRPYLDRDPPHVAPIDGKEYADHHHKAKTQHAKSDAKKRSRAVVRNEHGVPVRTRAEQSSRVRIIRVRVIEPGSRTVKWSAALP
jgi:hypothetical protein